MLLFKIYDLRLDFRERNAVLCVTLRRFCATAKSVELKRAKQYDDLFSFLLVFIRNIINIYSVDLCFTQKSLQEIANKIVT